MIFISQKKHQIIQLKIKIYLTEAWLMQGFRFFYVIAWHSLGWFFPASFAIIHINFDLENVR